MPSRPSPRHAIPLTIISSRLRLSIELTGSSSDACTSSSTSCAPATDRRPPDTLTADGKVAGL